MERLSDVEPQLRMNAFEMIKSEINGATASMTSVPKPLKFLTPLYPKLTQTFDKYTTDD